MENIGPPRNQLRKQRNQKCDTVVRLICSYMIATFGCVYYLIYGLDVLFMFLP